MVRNVYGLPTETQDSSEAGLLTQAFVSPVGERYASTIEISDADCVLYHCVRAFDTAEEARIDLAARLRVTEGITRDGVQRLLYAEDDYRGTFRLAEHRIMYAAGQAAYPSPELYDSLAGPRNAALTIPQMVVHAKSAETGAEAESRLEVWQEGFRSRWNPGGKGGYVFTDYHVFVYPLSLRSRIEPENATHYDQAEGWFTDVECFYRGERTSPTLIYHRERSFPDEAQARADFQQQLGALEGQPFLDFLAMAKATNGKLASGELGVFDTHDPASIGDIRPQNRYLGELITEHFVRLAGSTENYLQSLGAAPEVIQFIMTQPTDLAKRLVNETRKNPQITTQQLEEFVAQFSGQPKYEPTYRESFEADRFQEVPGMSAWVLLQLKKHRGRKVNRSPIGLESEKFPHYEFEYVWPPGAIRGAAAAWSISAVDATFQQIRDWVRATEAQLASYDFPSAIAESNKWHEEQAAQGAGGGYEEKNIVHKFDNGWTIQLVKSKNDLEVEGNHMGHCVGSYCREVTRGSSIIYSLRDPKNEPHATVEVKGDTESQEGDPYPYIRDTRYDTIIDHGPKEGEWNIVQIQGKQNQEPIAEYKAMIKEWLGTIEGKKTMADEQKNLDDALYYAAQDMKANEEILDKYANAGEGEVDDYGIPVEFQVSDPSDITGRTMSNYEHYINLNHRYYRFRGDLADSLADAAWKADEDYFSKPENDWQNYTRDFARRYPSLMQLPAGAPPKEQIQEYITDKSKYSAVQDMYSRNDDFYEKFQQHYMDSWYDDWVRNNPEPDQEDEDYETFAQFELAHDKWETAKQRDEEEAMDDALGEDPFGSFYSAFFERLSQIAMKRESPFEAWRQKQLSYAEPAKPLPRKRTPR